ncbi:MAG: hypothetical protein IKB88_02200 [Clostridia bacterium]|nr:hypothetical protein [Clostridia bacterium]
MSKILIIDGVDYSDTVFVDEIAENFVLAVGMASMTMQSGRRKHDIIGTEYSHTLLIRRNPMVSPEKWDEFYNHIAQPVEFHTVEVEHDQGTIIYEAHITNGGRTLIRRDGCKKIWSDLTLTFEPAEPQRGAK